MVRRNANLKGAVELMHTQLLLPGGTLIQIWR
jgi:hypothetical protein